MIRINLLPHREQKKAAHRLRFQLLLGATAVLSLLLLGAGYLALQHQIGGQETRNRFLQDEIGRLDRQIKDIGKLKRQRDDLLARKQLVERLQEGRNSAVHLFDQLLRQTPDGVYLKSFKQNGNQVVLVGYAQSGARVSNYMRQLGQSETFDAPVLVEVSSSVVNNQRVSAFTLNATMRQSPPAANKPAGATP
ncbi:fimbrial protein [Chromobacterium phragmitis]|uniref:Fimbrial protein n=1 Tax=Chromobacterium phragmitis TaxID=2202141 RepID=A0A344UHH9_9NEIS|nr:PilN domain-containing protein [Chromobacterium phragmitis]AXE29354.1 fimbrial protein [Chromobacterium phragmitis]AXE34727.1 fimbrial protein [Chromobacterium phragmitis]